MDGLVSQRVSFKCCGNVASSTKTENKEVWYNGRIKRPIQNVISGTSIWEIMQSFADFVNEKTLLQDKLSTLGVQVHRSPKCHLELAGEGIEYSWGHAKNYYQRLPLHVKRKKENFYQSVQSAMAQNRLITEVVINFARRARGYLCAYYALTFGNNRDQAQQSKRSHHNGSNKW